MKWAGPQLRITTSASHQFLELDEGIKQRIVSSNKNVPFDDFVILDGRWARWISKPNSKDRLQLEIKENEEPLKLLKTRKIDGSD